MTCHKSLNRAPLLDLFLALSVLAVAAGCGSKSPKVVAEATGGLVARNGGVAGASCRSKADCVAASMEVKGDGFGNAGLTGLVNEPVPWNFIGVDANDSSRRVAILLNNIPPGATVDPPIDSANLATTVKIVWTPSSSLRNEGAGLQIYMRDLDRCEVMESDPALCQQYRELPAYDVMSEIGWQVLSGTEDTDTVVTPAPSPTPSSNCTSSTGDTINKVVGGAKGIKSLSDGDLSGLGGILGMIGAVGELAGGGSPSC